MISGYKKTLFIRYYFIFGSILIVLFFLIYTNNLLHKVRNDLEVFPKIYARFVETSTQKNFEGNLLDIILSEVVKKIDFPIIVTDKNEQPKYWKNLDDSFFKDVKKEEFNQKKLKLLIREMKSSNSYIELTEPNTDKIISKIFYSESRTMKKLKFLPILELLVVLLFIAAGIIILIVMKKREKEHLWIALAKETAHQFGTPITSLLGWLQVLHSQSTSEQPDTTMLAEIEKHIKQDIKRLHNVASRFGKVGSSIKLQYADISETIKETIEYFKPRIPKMKQKIEIEFINLADQDKLLFEPDLMKWSMENLIKNSIDAMKGMSGKITIKTHDDEKHLYIQITDEGSGISKK